jgi:hypothetical protein
MKVVCINNKELGGNGPKEQLIVGQIYEIKEYEDYTGMYYRNTKEVRMLQTIPLNKNFEFKYSNPKPDLEEERRLRKEKLKKLQDV